MYNDSELKKFNKKLNNLINKQKTQIDNYLLKKNFVYIGSNTYEKHFGNEHLRIEVIRY
jgi:hypothetical protein